MLHALPIKRFNLHNYSPLKKLRPRDYVLAEICDSEVWALSTMLLEELSIMPLLEDLMG